MCKRTKLKVKVNVAQFINELQIHYKIGRKEGRITQIWQEKARFGSKVAKSG